MPASELVSSVGTGHLALLGCTTLVASLWVRGKPSLFAWSIKMALMRTGSLLPRAPITMTPQPPAVHHTAVSDCTSTTCFLVSPHGPPTPVFLLPVLVPLSSFVPTSSLYTHFARFTQNNLVLTLMSFQVPGVYERCVKATSKQLLLLRHRCQVFGL